MVRLYRLLFEGSNRVDKYKDILFKDAKQGIFIGYNNTLKDYKVLLQGASKAENFEEVIFKEENKENSWSQEDMKDIILIIAFFNFYLKTA